MFFKKKIETAKKYNGLYASIEELIEQKVVKVVDQDEKKQIIKFKVLEQTKNKILKQRKDSQMGGNND